MFYAQSVVSKILDTSRTIREFPLIGRVLPEATPEEVIWKFLFMIGSMAHTMCLSHDVEEMTEGLVDTADTEAIIERLVTFVSAGLRARVSATAERS